jgi:vanillate O-demethylase ferredoxin subunit
MHGTIAADAGVTAAQLLTVQVAEVRAEARDVMTLELRAPNGGSLPPFEPGAHLDLHLPNGLVRQYSLTNDWRERDRYVIGVGRAADSRGGSEYVHGQIRTGMQLKISAPRNNFPLDVDADRHLFIAGGIGVTPIMAMLRWCVAQGKPWRIIYAARSRQRAAFYEEICGAAGSAAQFHFDDECGLMEAVKGLTENLPSGTVRFEWFTVPETEQPQDSESFSVRLERRDEELRVPPDKSILEVLEEHGIEVPFSCREGLCGTCVTNVLDGEPDHRDYVLSDEERESGKLMTICCSRSKSPTLTLDL